MKPVTWGIISTANIGVAKSSFCQRLRVEHYLPH